MQLREVASQVDTGAQDKQLQLNLLGSSDAVFQQRNREVAIAEGALTRLEQELQQAKFELLQLDSSVTRLRTDCSGYEVEQKTSLHRYDALTQELIQVRQQQDAAAQAARGSRGPPRRGAGRQDGHARGHDGGAAGPGRPHPGVSRRAAGPPGHRPAARAARRPAEAFAAAPGTVGGFRRGREGGPAGTPGRRPGGRHRRPPFPRPGSAARVWHGDRGAPRVRGRGDQRQRRRDRPAGSGAAGERTRSARPSSGSPSCAGPPSAAVELPPGLAPATAALRDPRAEHPAVALLAACYVADDLNSFLEFWRSRPDFDFLAVATRRGEIVDRRGLVSGGHRSDKKRTDGIVQREIDLRETARALADEQKRHDDQKAVIDALAARLAEAEQALELRRVELLAATQTVAAAQADQRGTQKVADDAASRLRRMEQEMKTVEDARNEAQSRWQKAQLGLSEAEGLAAAQREKISSLEAKLAETRVEREAKREGLAQARLELAERRQKVEVLDRGPGRDGEAPAAARRAPGAAPAGDRGLDRAVRRAGARVRRRARPRRAAGGHLRRSPASRWRRSASRLVEVERAITALETEQAGLRAESDSAHGDLSAQEIRLAQQRQRAIFLADEVTREFQADVATLDWPRLLWRADDEPEGLQALDLDDEEPAAPPRPRRPSRARRRPRRPRRSPRRASRRSRRASRPRPTLRRSKARTGRRSRPRSTPCASGSRASGRSTSSRSRNTPS